MKRLAALDIYKALAIVMVIIIHVTATPIVTLTSGAGLDVLIVMNRFSLPSVPMFIFASGLSLFHVYKDRAFDYFQFLRKRLSKILVPYLTWCILYYAYYVYEGIYDFSAQTFLLNVLSGRMMYHLYFVVIIIQFYLVFGLISFVVKRFSGLIILPIGLAINFLALQILPASYLDRSFMTYMIYFLLGCYFAKNMEMAALLINRFKILLTLGFFAAGGLYAYQFYAGQVLGIGDYLLPSSYVYIGFCAIAVLVFYRLSMAIDHGLADPENWLRRGLLAISDGSFYIYLSHPLAIIAAGSISARLGITGVIDQMLVALALIWITSVPLSILYAARKGKSASIKAEPKEIIEEIKDDRI